MASPKRIRAPSSPKDRKSPISAIRFDQDALNFTPSQSGTTYAGSTAPTATHESGNNAETSSGASVYSYDSQRDAGKFVKEVEGRVSDLP